MSFGLKRKRAIQIITSMRIKSQHLWCYGGILVPYGQFSEQHKLLAIVVNSERVCVFLVFVLWSVTLRLKVLPKWLVLYQVYGISCFCLGDCFGVMSILKHVQSCCVVEVSQWFTSIWSIFIHVVSVQLKVQTARHNLSKRGAPVTATRLLLVLSLLFTVCADHGWLTQM